VEGLVYPNSEVLIALSRCALLDFELS
jgi:hypothetical protein